MKLFQICTCLFVVVLLQTLMQCSILSKRLSFFESNVRNRTILLRSPWSNITKIQCLSSCLKKYKDSCQSFVYNMATRNCTPGRSIFDGLFGAADSEDVLYVQYPDFMRLSDSSVSICVVLFQHQANYWDASKICKIYDAHLYVPRSNESFNLFRSSFNNTENIWVGMNIVGSNRTLFVADDTNEIIDFNSIQSMFGTLQPDNNGGQQNCVRFASKCNFKLDDESCEYNSSIVCETSLENC